MSVAKHFFWWRELRKKIWFSVLCYTLLGIGAALAGLRLDEFVTDHYMVQVDGKSVSNDRSI